MFFLFSLCINSCAKPQVADDFYRGLLGKSDTDKIHESVKLFENALTSSNPYIRQAAAGELAGLYFGRNLVSGEDLSRGTVNLIRSETSRWWAAAFEVFENSPDKEKILNLLLSSTQRDVIPEEVRTFLLQECARNNIFFTETELAAINGHFAISHLRYNEALRSFRIFQEGGDWPAQIPAIFLQYPVLINDLGRALQFTASGTEGLSLFLQWENELVIDTPETARYRLLFFAARIARRNGLNARAISLFEQALSFSPDAEQSDACVWYILDLALRENADFFIDKLEQVVSHWQNRRYFNIVLERFLQTLASASDWKRIIRVFNLIQDSQSPVKAAYAWVIARVIEEGFLSDEEMVLAIMARSNEPLVYFQLAYNVLHDDVSSLLYYRLLTSSILGLPFLDMPLAAASNQDHSPAVQFLLGFFTHNAQAYALPYIRQIEQELSPDELRVVAQAMKKAGMYADTIRLVSRYIHREGHTITRCDMELLFPRSYIELVEEHSALNDFEPELIFALIRTESAFQSSVVSHAGAVGLTQLMPATAREMAGRIRRAGGPDYAASVNGLDLNDPAQNIHIGVYYLNYLMERFDDQLLALFAYNGGMNRVRRWRAVCSLPIDLFLETVIFHETRDYGRKVLSAAAVYKELYY